MNLLPPANSPLRLQSRIVRDTLLEDHAAFEKGRADLFQPQPHCPRGHKLVPQAAPVRVGCSQCRMLFSSAAGAFCCARCGGREWRCAHCVVWHEHVMRAAAHAYGTPHLSPLRSLPLNRGGGGGKLRYGQAGTDLRARQVFLQAGAAVAAQRLDRLAQGSPDGFAGGRPAAWGPGAPLASPSEQRLSSPPGGYSYSPGGRRPRKHLPATPKSFFKTNDPELAKSLGLAPPPSLEERRANLRLGAEAVRGFAEASLARRQTKHDAVLLAYLRSLDGGSEISSDVASSADGEDSANGPTEAGSQGGAEDKAGDRGEGEAGGENNDDAALERAEGDEAEDDDTDGDEDNAGGGDDENAGDGGDFEKGEEKVEGDDEVAQEE